jgi:peptide/nickel transport system substrate-binding protein
MRRAEEATMEQKRGTATRITRRRIVGASAALGAASAVVACAASPRTGSGGAKASVSGQPKAGGEFNWAQVIDAFDFDPTGNPLQNGPWIELAYNALLSVKRGPDVKYSELVVQPGLARSWETPDGQTYTFHLQPGARFQDLPPVNGRAVTSADVKWSLEYQSRTGQFRDAHLPPSLNDNMYTGLDRIETPDPATVVVHFGKPFVPFTEHMALERNGILAHEIFDRDGNFTNTLVGTGPWQLDTAASQHGSRWVMKRNPNYFLQGLPYIDRFNCLVLVDSATNLAAFQTKQVDLLDKKFVTPSSAPQIQKDNPTAVDFPCTDTSGGLIYENVRRAPLNDLRIRKAIALSLDRDGFIQTFSGGEGEWAVAGGESGLFSRDEVRQMVKFDPAQARQLVTQAGFPNGVELELTFPGKARGELYVSTIELAQAHLKAANIHVTLKEQDVSAFSKTERSGDFQLVYEAKPQVGDIDAYIYYNWYSKSLGNFGAIDDPKLDALLEQQRREVDPAKRRETLRQAVRYIADNAYYTAFFYGKRHFFWQPYLKNFAPNIAHNGAPIYESWLER